MEPWRLREHGGVRDVESGHATAPLPDPAAKNAGRGGRVAPNKFSHAPGGSGVVRNFEMGSRHRHSAASWAGE